MILNIYYLSGNIKFKGNIPRQRLPKILQKSLRNPNYKLYDLDHVTLFLHFFNNYLVHEYDQDGTLKDYGKVENGKFKRDYKRISNPQEEVPSHSFDFYNVMEGNPPFPTSLNSVPIDGIFNGYYPPNDFPRAENISLDYNDDSSDDSSDDISDDSSDDSSYNSDVVYIHEEDLPTDWKSLYENHYEGEEFNGMPNGKGILYDVGSGDPTYVGNFLNGNFHRKGIIYIDGKKIYSGEWKDGQRHGYGKSYYKGQNQRFEGLWKKDFPYSGKIYSNQGKLIFDGLFKDFSGFFPFYEDVLLEKIYLGKWKNGKKDGYGILKKFNSLEYKGFWKQGKMSGKGELFEKGFLRYNGEFKENERDGQGVQYYRNGKVKYEGGWKKGKEHGYGQEYTDFQIYKGLWKDGMKEGYGVEWEECSENENYYKSFSGLWKDNKKVGEGLDYFENGMLCYEGEYNEVEEGFGKEFYLNGNLRYIGQLKNGKYDGKGKLFYQNETLCFEGDFLNGQFYHGTFYDMDGSVHQSYCQDGDYYCYGITLSPHESGFISYRGIFKNGKFHGKGVMFRDENEIEYDGEFKNGKFHGQGTFYRDNDERTIVSGTFLNDFYFDEEGHCLKKLHFNKKHDVIVYRGSIKDEKYDTGIEYIFKDDDVDFEYPSIGSVTWKDGEIFDEKKERLRLTKELNILNYLETKNKKKLEKIYKKDYITFLKEKYNVEETELGKKTKKQLLRDIEEKKRKKNEIDETETEAETDVKFDLFGNEIIDSVVGFDNEIYDESSMKYLFQRNDENEFVNITYSYDENYIRRPNYPIMANGKKLDGYTKGKIKVYEYATSRVETREDENNNLLSTLRQNPFRPFLNSFHSN